VLKQAQTTLERRNGRRFRLFDLPAIEAWWKTQHPEEEPQEKPKTKEESSPKSEDKAPPKSEDKAAKKDSKAETKSEPPAKK
jgi:hypothetical protein